MSEKEQKIIRIAGNGLVHFESMQDENKEMVYTIKHGAVGIQLKSKEVRTLYFLLENALIAENKESEKIREINIKANINYSKQFH